MPLVDASQQALIKASYKDTFYINILRHQLNSLCQRIFGDKLWILWRKEIEVIADLCYFLLTTVSGSQTLGEEYVCTIQVDSSRRKIPTKLQRLFQVFLQCTSPYLFEKVIKEIQVKVPKLHGLSSNQKRKLIICMSFIYKLIPVIEQFHLLLFYMEGVYVSLSKRIAGIKHILIRPYDECESDTATFRWLAILGGIQMLCKLADIITELKNESVEPTIEHRSALVAKRIESQNKCILCLEGIREISSTICGHMFCWNCIIDWCSIKPECPTCRELCPPSRVVRLHHYDTS